MTHDAIILSIAIFSYQDKLNVYNNWLMHSRKKGNQIESIIMYGIHKYQSIFNSMKYKDR